MSAMSTYKTRTTMTIISFLMGFVQNLYVVSKTYTQGGFYGSTVLPKFVIITLILKNDILFHPKLLEPWTSSGS